MFSRQTLVIFGRSAPFLVYSPKIIENIVMKVADQQHLRERVFLYRKNNTKAEVVRHFTSENYSRSTIYNILKRYEEGLPVERTPKTGRPPKLNKRKLTQLKKLASETIGASQRKLARKLSVSQSTIHYNLKKLNLKGTRE